MPAPPATAPAHPGAGPSPRRRATRHARHAGLALLLLSLLLLGWHLALAQANQRDLAALARAGHPIDLDDLPLAALTGPAAATPALPADTACAHYQAAFALYPPRAALAESATLLPFVGDEPVLAPDEAFSPAAATALHTYVAAHAASLDALRAGNGLPLGGYYGPGGAAGMRFQAHHDAVRRGTRLLALAAMDATLAGDAEATVANLRAGVLLGESLRGEAGVEPFAARLAARPPPVQALAWCLSHGQFSAAQLRALATVLAASDDLTACARAFEAHRVLGIGALSHLTDPVDELALALTGGWTPVQRVQCQLLSVSQWEMHCFLTASQPLSAALAQPPPARLPATLAAQREARALAGSGFARQLVFQAPLLEQWDDNGIVHARCAQLALSIELHHLSTGRWPTSLAELAPADVLGNPQDTFGPDLLHYALATTGYRVYSVGHNGVDDGGDGRCPNPTSPPRDEVLARVFLPAHPAPAPRLPLSATTVVPTPHSPPPVLP